MMMMRRKKRKGRRRRRIEKISKSGGERLEKGWDRLRKVGKGGREEVETHFGGIYCSIQGPRSLTIEERSLQRKKSTRRLLNMSLTCFGLYDGFRYTCI